MTSRLQRSTARTLLVFVLAGAVLLAGPARPASAGVMQWVTQIPPSVQGATIEAKTGAGLLGGTTGAYAGWLSKPTLSASMKWGALGAAVGVVGWVGYEMYDDGIVADNSLAGPQECYGTAWTGWPSEWDDGWASIPSIKLCWATAGINGDGRWMFTQHATVDDVAQADLEGLHSFSIKYRGPTSNCTEFITYSRTFGESTWGGGPTAGPGYGCRLDWHSDVDPVEIQYHTTAGTMRISSSVFGHSYMEVVVVNGVSTTSSHHALMYRGEVAGEVVDRVTRGTYRCVEYGTGSVLEPLVADTDAWTPTEGGGPIPTPELECPSGYMLDGLTLEAVDTGGGLEPIPLADWTAPTTELETTYPLCMPGTSGGPCALELHRVTTTGTEVCDVGTCAGWWHDPNRESKFECHWGAYVMDSVADCVSLQKSYNTGTALELTPSTDLATGEAIQLDQPAPEESGCGISWLNPFTGMARAVGCALEWAFVPQAGTMTQTFTEMRDLTLTKQPVATLNGWATWFGDLGNIGQGCFDITLQLDHGPTTVMDSCAPDAVSAWLQSKRGVLEVMIWIGFLAPLLWWAWGKFFPGSEGMA